MHLPWWPSTERKMNILYKIERFQFQYTGYSEIWTDFRGYMKRLVLAFVEFFLQSE